MSTAVATIDTTRPAIPLSRLVKVELRKMFDTRSGFWLMMSIGIVATIATIACIIFVPNDNLEYSVFGTAIGVPFAILLPVVAILSVTGEWSQRTGLITFTLLPHRGQVILAKAIAAIIVAVVSMIFSFAVGALGNVVGSALNGVDTRWDVSVADMLYIILANILGLMVGFMLGVLIRNSAGAIVAYFVYSFVIPGIFGFLAATQDWFEKIQPWIDFNDAQTPLFDGGPSGEQWAQIGTSSLIWFIIPLSLGVMAVLKSEVK
ncbi:ABC transporter permease [Aeromicrobium ginsengisoli]|uniref:ABC transporter permease subunit n=1 Tax=Aeromicrobium ginsengisoli TaxID=363867 RepID=A0A5M4FFE6_9ACTN|nr:ABC transporter permease [Aeromicrobium ginsengisoli]KAA1398087.1 ABC transporter permease subunit [Aeromicrobium ginsengisoli]